MRLSIGLGALALCAAVACGDDSSDDDGSSEVSRAVSEALTEGVEFDNGVLRTGSIPESSADTVTLSQDDDVLRLAPGDSSLMSLGVDNPEDDPVESTLIQFQDADDHVEIPSGDGDAGIGEGELTLNFTVNADICDAFCNDIFTIRMIQAVRLRGGGVSRHLLRTLELDCRADGDEDLCESAGDPDASTSSGGSGGSGGAGGTGSGSTTTALELSSAISQVNLAACMCAMPGATDPYCATAPYARADVMCIRTAVGEDDALSGAASCLEMQLDTAAAGCTCADIACYGSAIATALSSCNDTAALETALMDCNIATTATAPGDAGL